LGFAIAALILAIRSKKMYGQGVFEGIDGYRIRRVASEYRKFPLFTLPRNFLSTLSRNLPTFLLATWYSPAVLGLFFLGFRVFSGPMSIISNSMSNVFYQRASRDYIACRPIFSLIIKLYIRLFLLALPPSILLFTFAEQIFVAVFGESWSEAGRYLKYILPWLVINFTTSPSHHVLNVVNKQEIFLIYDLIILGLRYGAFVFGAAWFTDPAYTLGLYSFVGLLGYIALAAVILFLAARADQRKAGASI
jgi:O-antigen/teichoic acid export membrane protein